MRVRWEEDGFGKKGVGGRGGGWKGVEEGGGGLRCGTYCRIVSGPMKFQHEAIDSEQTGRSN